MGRGLGGLGGAFGWLSLFGLGLGAGLALFLRLLHIFHGGAEGALQFLPYFIYLGEQSKLLDAAVGFFIDLGFALGGARQQPLGADHGFEVAQFGASLGFPIEVEIVPEAQIFGGIFG